MWLPSVRRLVMAPVLVASRMSAFAAHASRLPVATLRLPIPYAAPPASRVNDPPTMSRVPLGLSTMACTAVAWSEPRTSDHRTIRRRRDDVAPGRRDGEGSAHEDAP